MTLRLAMQEVQKVGLQHGFTIIIVGGAIVRLIGPHTIIKKIDEKENIITLEHAENPGTKRGEDQKTTVDIDAIAFSNATDPFAKEVKNEFEELTRALRILKNAQSDFPAISLEPVLYHPYFSRPNLLTQFVSSVESYHDHDFFFRLGSVKQDVSRSSLKFWTLHFSETKDEIITFMPPAIQKRYVIRGFSIKPKDKDKVWGEKSQFAKFVNEFTQKTKKKYEKDFFEWDELAEKIQKTKEPSMKIKKALWNTYWNTIGTYLAHGTGIIGKVLLPLGNNFFAGK